MAFWTARAILVTNDEFVAMASAVDVAMRAAVEEAIMSRNVELAVRSSDMSLVVEAKEGVSTAKASTLTLSEEMASAKFWTVSKVLVAALPIWRILAVKSEVELDKAVRALESWSID